MPTFPDTASGLRGRIRPPAAAAQDFSDSESARGTPAVSARFVSRISARNGEDDIATSSSSGQGSELPEAFLSVKDNNVQVIIRIRPLHNSEISVQGHNKCVRQDNTESITWTGHPESRFTFDLVADEQVTQESLFKVAGLPMVENCMGGYNSCMFAYGQTGSGKTYTMLGDVEGGSRRHSVHCGMTPRVFEYLFSRIQKEKDARVEEKLKFTCKISFLEIYNEQILDLLDPSSVNLQIREDAKKGVYVENLKEIEVSSARDVLQQIVQGAANRKVAATNMNHSSSRSHSVFTCVIESKWESQGIIHRRFAQLNLVDLAGSERQKSSGAEGERLKEATNINKSLSTLGLVIMSLVSISNGKSSHVPYRDSKLTFLLQDSLGGNSKTIIIANISPSICCALETLSTLKFAQRAKFIRNNAIVNEDASGDILALRMQNQELKKEVNCLRAQLQEKDNKGSCLLGSPGLFKWEGPLESLNPLISGRTSSKSQKELEISLVGAFKRLQEKEIELEALTAENQATVQLAKQREAEIQSLRMRLRFREDGIKRLEAVASEKLSAETHLSQEKGELLGEIEVLRNQVDRNQDATRFAMENLRLNEEIRQLRLFYENGERERMNDLNRILQDQVSEKRMSLPLDDCLYNFVDGLAPTLMQLCKALDWKHAHERDADIKQSGNLGTPSRNDDSLLLSNEDPLSPWLIKKDEENEFLRIQAIQHENQIEALRRKLESCLEAKRLLEKRVKELEDMGSTNDQQGASQQPQISLPGSTETDSIPGASHDQMELQILVDAIAAASQREAEAHQTTIILAKENEELRTKLKVLFQDNNKLIELYDGAIAVNKKAEEDCSKPCALSGELSSEDLNTEGGGSKLKDVKQLECQLQEMHEENEKLMGLYEKAMQERDEFKRVCQEKLYAEDGLCKEANESIDLVQNKVHEEELSLVKEKLETVDSKVAVAVKAMSYSKLIDEANILIYKLSREIDLLEDGLKAKQHEVSVLRKESCEAEERKAVMYNKFAALKAGLSNFNISADYWVQREARHRARLEGCCQYLAKMKDELACLQARKDETAIACRTAQQMEAELKNTYKSLKLEFRNVENQRKTEKVLFAIDNMECTDVPLHRDWHSGKASELLRSEVERTKLPAELKQLKEKLLLVHKEVEDLSRKSEELDAQIQTVTLDITKGTQKRQDSEADLKTVIHEKEVLFEMREKVRSDIEKLIVDYQGKIFVGELKEAEIVMCEEEICEMVKHIDELKADTVAEAKRRNQVVAENTWFDHECVVQELEDAQRSVLLAGSLLAR